MIKPNSIIATTTKSAAISTASQSNQALVTQRLRALCRGCVEPPIFICIGSDRVTGDAIGPLVGHFLINQYRISSFVYGNLATPITALNISQICEFVKHKHINRKIIAIDACVGKLCDVGKIKVSEEALFPGSAAGKSLPPIGDVSIKAIVSNYSPLSSAALNGVRLGLVHQLACQIAEGISQFMQANFPHAAISAAEKALLSGSSVPSAKVLLGGDSVPSTAAAI